MTIFYVILYLVSASGLEHVCYMQAEEVQNAETCQERADLYNDDSPVFETADGRYLMTVASCETEI